MVRRSRSSRGKPGGFSNYKRRFKSKFEAKIGRQLFDKKIPIDYENVKIKYEQPSQKRTYTPDFILPNGIIVETKGRLTQKNRAKHLWIKEQYPELDIRFVFQKASNKIYKGSKTSYADWAEKYGFIWAEGSIPPSWFSEPAKSIPYDDETIIRRDDP